MNRTKIKKKKILFRLKAWRKEIIIKYEETQWAKMWGKV